MSEQTSNATSRKPLDAQFVGGINADAMKALADVKARLKWAGSRSGSPLTTNILCAEISRLNQVIEQIAAVAKDNHSDDKNSAAMALRFVEELAARAVSQGKEA